MCNNLEMTVTQAFKEKEIHYGWSRMGWAESQDGAGWAMGRGWTSQGPVDYGAAPGLSSKGTQGHERALGGREERSVSCFGKPS